MDWAFELMAWMTEKVIFPGLTIVLLLAMLAGAAFVGTWLIGLGRDKWTIEVGTVVGKSYTPDTQQTSTVPVATGEGVGVGVVTTGNPETWTTLIDVGGTVERFNSPTIWAKTKVGDKVQCHIKTNPIWGRSLGKVGVPR